MRVCMCVIVETIKPIFSKHKLLLLLLLLQRKLYKIYIIGVVFPRSPTLLLLLLLYCC